MSQAGTKWDRLTDRSVVLSTPTGKSKGNRVLGGGGPAQLGSGIPSPLVSDVFVSVLFVSSGPGKDVCGGRVGVDNTKFCTLPCVGGSTSCRFATHDKKANVEAPAFYICTSKAGAAYVNPRVVEPTIGFSQMVLSAMEDTKTTNEWNDLFSVLNGFEEMSTGEQIEAISRVNRKVTLGLTPMQKRIRTDSEDLEQVMLNIADSESWAGDSVEKIDQMVIDDFSSEVEFVAHAHKNWNELVHHVSKGRTNAEDSNRSTRNCLEEIDRKVLTATAYVGIPTVNSPALNLWDSIDAHTAMINSITVRLGDEKEIGELSQQAMAKRVKVIEDTLENNLAPILTNLASKMEEFEGQKQGGIDRDARTEIARLSFRMEDIYSEMKAYMTQGSGGQSARTGNVDEDMGDGSEEVKRLQVELGKCKDELEAVRREMLSIRNQINSDTITIQGFNFQTSDSYLAFVRNETKDGDWAFCFDFVSVFQMHCDPDQSADSVLQSNHLIGRLGYRDVQSARIDNSFRTLIPNLFGVEQDPKDPSKKMGKLSTMDIWDHPTSQSGVKEDINVFMDTTVTSLLMQVESRFGSCTVPTLFYSTIVQGILTFWNALEAWITRFEKDLTAQSGGDTSKAQKDSIWKLICWMLHAMFKEMLKRRRPGLAMAVFTTGTVVSEDLLQRKCASILEGTLAAHRFMKELISDSFVRHPIFASTMDEYLLKSKATQSALVELQSKVALIDGRLKGTQATVDRMSSDKKKGGGASPAQK